MTQKVQEIKKWYRLSNIIFYFLLVLVIAGFIFPDVKAFFINNLMKIGLFQPRISQTTSVNNNVNLFTHNDLGFRNAEGNLDISTLKEKVVIINFWATWCPPCRAELPSLNDFNAKWASNPKIKIILIDADNKLEESNSFLKQKKWTLPNYTSWTRWNSNVFGGALPTTIVFDKSGKMVYRHEGAMDFNSDKFNQFIESLL